MINQCAKTYRFDNNLFIFYYPASHCSSKASQSKIQPDFFYERVIDPAECAGAFDTNHSHPNSPFQSMQK